MEPFRVAFTHIPVRNTVSMPVTHVKAAPNYNPVGTRLYRGHNPI